MLQFMLLCPLLCIFFVFLANGCALAEEASDNTPVCAPLELEFTLTLRETSKDNNWCTFTVKIDRDMVCISKEYGGFNALENEHRSKKMTPALQNDILSFLQKHQLDQNFQEIRTTEGIGRAGTLRLEVTSPNASLIEIAGRTNIWGKQGQEKTNLQNINVVRNAERFFQFLWGEQQSF